METAWSVYSGMLGLNAAVPGSPLSVDSASVFWVLGMAAIALGCPNSLQILDRYNPSLGWKPRPITEQGSRAPLAWRPSLAWAITLSIITTLAVLYLGGQSEFLYWQF
jgi:hypothetical protein